MQTKNTEVNYNRAFEDITKSNLEIASSLKTVAKSLDNSKIKLDHSRYAELMNKDRLLTDIKTYFSNFASILFAINSSKEIENYQRNPHPAFSCDSNYKELKVEISENLFIIINDIDLTLKIFYKKEEFLLKQTAFIPITTGDCTINGDLYETLLNKEIELEKYLKAYEEISNLGFLLITTNPTRNHIDYSNSYFYYFIHIDEMKSLEKGMDIIGNMTMHFSFKTKNFNWGMMTKRFENNFVLYLKD